VAMNRCPEYHGSVQEMSRKDPIGTSSSDTNRITFNAQIHLILSPFFIC
jgi:hypothetical protein